jgi:death-on-curing family protein
MVKRISSARIVELHHELVDVFRHSGDPISPPGVKDANNLERAVTRPWTVVAGEEAFRGLEKKAAILAWSLVCYHPFHNGNKRTAILALRELLALNGRTLVSDNDEILEFSDRVVATCGDRSDAPYAVITEWIADHTTDRFSLHQRRWRDVLRELKALGIDGTPRKGFLVLKRDEGPSLTVAFHGATREADESVLRKIRSFFAL